MPKGITKPKLPELSDEENDNIYDLAKGRGHTDAQIKNIFKKVEKREPSFLDMQRLLKSGLTEKKIISILDLSDELEIATLKETNSFTKDARQRKPKKVKDRISQYTRAISGFEKSLERIKNFELDKDMNIKIPLEGGKFRDMHFKSRVKFEAYMENEIANVQRSGIERSRKKLEYWETLKKFKAVMK